MPLYVHILQKKQFASFTKISPSQKKRLNVHGNVIHIANLLASIGDKKLYIQVNYRIYHIKVIDIVSHENIWNETGCKSESANFKVYTSIHQ